jgi:predicted enzyme related to lactoylglutathione lyase
MAQPQQIKWMLVATDLQRAKHFYTQVFDLHVHYENDHWIELTDNKTIIALTPGHDGRIVPSGIIFQMPDVFQCADLILQHQGLILNYPNPEPNSPLILGQAQDTEGNQFFISEYTSSNL